MIILHAEKYNHTETMLFLSALFRCLWLYIINSFTRKVETIHYNNYLKTLLIFISHFPNIFCLRQVSRHLLVHCPLCSILQ